MPETHETIISARTVLTGTGVPANAVLVRDGRIAAVGDRKDLLALSPRAHSVDLPGATITPGLIDAHVHLTEWALTRTQTDLAASSSPAHAADLMKSAASAGTGWIRGRGWSAHDWNGGRPHRTLLDAVAPDRPMVLQSHDMHSLWLNTAALEAVGITAGTPDPAGGRIEHDENGQPTGVLLENAAQFVLAHMAPPTAAQARAAVAEGQRVLHRLGITGVHSFPGIHIPEPDPFTIVQQLFECDVLRLRILQHLSADKLDAAIATGIRSGFGNEWIRIGGVKLFLDGALGSRTAWMREPYERSDSRGVNTLERDAFRDIVVRAASAGIASTVHAIGDAAVSMAIDELSPPERGVAALPHRIEHVQCCPPERYADFARARIVCSMQPCHLINDWQAADLHWGERGRHTYAFGSLAANGAVLAFGSDAPVESIDPRRSLLAAVLRQDLSLEPAGGWYPQERISAEAALAAFTAGPAFAAGTQGVQGVLAEGAWADMAAWSESPLEVDPSMITDLRCEATIVGGHIVHS